MTDKLTRPIGSPDALRSLLERVRGNVDSLVPESKAEAFRDRLFQLVLLSANKQPKLLQCTAESITQSVMDAAQVGLDLSVSRGEAALVPYFNNKSRVYECQFIPMYRGLARLARNSGEVKRIEAEVVHRNDFFKYDKGTNVEVIFSPDLYGDRGDKMGVYALAEYTSGAVQAVYLSAADVDRVRNVSKMKDAGPWKMWPDEMWKKTAFRNLSKWLTLDSDRFYAAIEIADREYAVGEAEPEDDEINDRMGLNAPEVRQEQTA